MAYSKGSYESSKKYKEKNIKRVPLDVQIEMYERIKQAAEANGETVNGFIKQAISERLNRVQTDTGRINKQDTDSTRTAEE